MNNEKKRPLAMVSVIMGGRADEEIKADMEEARTYLDSKGYDMAESFFDGPEYTDEALKNAGIVNIPLYFLAKSLECMTKCEAMYFCKGWENARGCRLEHEAAKAYGMTMFYQE